MMRRDFLTSIPVAALAAASPAMAEPTETAISILFAEWECLHDHANERGISDDEHNRRIEETYVIESKIQKSQVATIRDLALKALADSGMGNFDLSPGFWAEMHALADRPDTLRPGAAALANA